jgi:hypothetical protein
MRPLAEWEQANPGTVHDPEWFHHDVLPRLTSVKLSEIAEAARRSKVYASDIRRGKWTPNLSTWAALAQLAEVVNDRCGEWRTWAVRAEPRATRGSTFTAGLLLLIERSGGSPPRMHRVCEGAVEGKPDQGSSTSVRRGRGRTRTQPTCVPLIDVPHSRRGQGRDGRRARRGPRRRPP